MLLIKILPLSFAVFWRFMLVLPAWALIYILLAATTFYGFLTLIGGIPVVGVFLLIVAPIAASIVSYIISMHPYLIGIRIGLRVLGQPTEPSQHKLMVAAVGYGLVEGLVAALFSLVIFALWLLLMQSGLDDLRIIMQQRVTDPTASLSTQIAFGRYTAMTMISAVCALLLRAALLPVLASAAAGRRPTGGAHRPFDGFGAQLPVMVLLLLMIAALSTVVLPFMGSGAEFLGLTQVLVTKLDSVILFVTGKSQTHITLLHAVIVLGAISTSVWLFALQCAGAALAYAGGGGGRPKPPSSKLPPISSDDISALRRARMQKPQR